MPKEKIYSEHQGQLVRGDDGKEITLDREPFIDLSWGRDGSYVQLGVLRPNDHGPDPIDADGWFIQLNRYGINKLITTLRKARDQAYGKDA